MACPALNPGSFEKFQSANAVVPSQTRVQISLPFIRASMKKAAHIRVANRVGSFLGTTCNAQKTTNSICLEIYFP